MARPKGKGEDITKPKTIKVLFSPSGNGNTTTKVNISKSRFESIGVTEEKPYISVICKDNKIIIEPKEGV